HTFTGWYTDSALTNPYDFSTPVTTSGLTLYGKWSADIYSVSYNLDGGATSNPTTYTTDILPITLTNPTRSGYDFTGWSNATATGSGPIALTGGTIIPTGTYGNITLTANWKAQSYTVNFDTRDSLSYPVTSSFESTEVAYGSRYDEIEGWEEEPTRPGYDFKGWYTDPSLASTRILGRDTIPDKDTTLCAVWTPKRYVITYSLGGGLINGNYLASYTVDTSWPLTLPTPVREANYVFEGWKVTSAESGSVSLLSAKTASLSLLDASNIYLPEGTYGDLTVIALWSGSKAKPEVVTVIKHDKTKSGPGVNLRIATGEILSGLGILTPLSLGLAALALVRRGRKEEQE
ncbi:MAG: InlB B-repeat-containing protein, partial [Actinomycetes bacterium]|nr:InlB B-repeat-containing protein [Actinomycetes bacterium]